MSKQTRKKPSKAPARKAVAAGSRSVAKVKTSPKKSASTRTAIKPGAKAKPDAKVKTDPKSSAKTRAIAKAPAKTAAGRKTASPSSASVTGAAPRRAVRTAPEAAELPAKSKAKTLGMPASKPKAAAVPEPVKAQARPPQTDKTETRPAPIGPAAAGLSEGSPAPAFALPGDGGETLSLASFANRKLVIFFFPRADTPGCTREAIDFSRLQADFAASDAGVLGVSADPLKAQQSFRNKHQLTTPLLSDETHAMLEAYGAWGEKSMYGRTFQGVLRTTVAIGADGRIAKIWRGVKVDGHADEVLAFVQSL